MYYLWCLFHEKIENSGIYMWFLILNTILKVKFSIWNFDGFEFNFDF